MKPYQKARIIELIAIVLGIAILAVGMSAGFIERFGDTGSTIARIAAILIALGGIIGSRKFSVCPHCGQTINALSRYCSACGKKLKDEPKK
ncbi:MAG: zinc ribbon domain-containing protein [Lachnospiraceae bacterium]|nr:zinc ribbon domain-containing protein [Lachnospiraceae bacterium]